MSLPESHVDGEPIAYQQAKPSGTLEREAAEFAWFPAQISTGKAESEWLGARLLVLAAKGGEWRAVPWRMLRNEYMGYDRVKRVVHKNEKRLPKLFEDEPVVEYVLGGGTPVKELLIGIKHLLDCGLAEVVTREDEDYVVPTNKLLKLVPKKTSSFSDR